MKATRLELIRHADSVVLWGIRCLITMHTTRMAEDDSDSSNLHRFTANHVETNSDGCY